MMTSCERFLAELSKSSGRNTCGAYERDLKAFSEYFAALGVTDPALIDSRSLREYFSSLVGSCAPSSVNRRISVVRSFYKYLVLNGECEVNPALSLSFENTSAPLKKAEALSCDMLDDLLSQPDPFDPKGRRDRAMLEMCIAGVRVTELVELSLESVDIKKGAVICESGKHPRVVRLDPDALRFLSEYLELSRPRLVRDPSTPWLFVNVSGDQMTRQGFWKIIKYYASCAGIGDAVSPLSLKRSVDIRLTANKKPFGKTAGTVKSPAADKPAKTSCAYAVLASGSAVSGVKMKV